jgi:hypothetical protein
MREIYTKFHQPRRNVTYPENITKIDIPRTKAQSPFPVSGSFGEIIMDRETSARVSGIASRLLNFTTTDFLAIANGAPDYKGPTIGGFCDDVRTLAGSCMAQDETPGQEQPKGDFFSRLKDEREDLDRRLIALNSFLTHNPGHPNARHYEMLRKQATIMSELLSVLDERIADIEISRRSEINGANQ